MPLAPVENLVKGLIWIRVSTLRTLGRGSDQSANAEFDGFAETVVANAQRREREHRVSRKYLLD